MQLELLQDVPAVWPIERFPDITTTAIRDLLAYTSESESRFVGLDRVIHMAKSLLDVVLPAITFPLPSKVIPAVIEPSLRRDKRSRAQTGSPSPNPDADSGPVVVALSSNFLMRYHEAKEKGCNHAWSVKEAIGARAWDSMDVSASFFIFSWTVVRMLSSSVSLMFRDH